MTRQEALEHYLKSLKAGQKSYRSAVMHGRYPYPQVLDEILDESMDAGRVELGIVEIPSEQIVGTKTAGRKNTFADNFMPLMEPETEFGVKWVQLCMAHLGEGIREPIRCFEYLGRFYVQEGNKRVSVLKSYEASTIPGYVTRIIPAYSEEPKIQIYYEFMQFYQLSKLYQVNFTQLGSFAKLQAALGFDADHVWTEDERKMFLSCYARFRDFFRKQGGEQMDITVADALLVWLKVYSMRELKEMTASELTKSLARVWPDVKLLDNGAAIAIYTDPNLGDRGVLSYLLSGGRHANIKVAFFFHADPAVSAFTRSHELGAEYVRDRMKEDVTVSMHYGVRADESGEWVMERAVAEGAQVLFATAPPLIGICRKVAARHPNVKVLNCSLSMPYVGVRTYYSRIYESKFIAGALAAAVGRDDVLGYVADYPIYGVPASINAFALGARLVNPNARVRVEWSCVPGDPYAVFAKEGIRTVTNREVSSPQNTEWYWNQGTYRMMEDGTTLPIASPAWNWGAFYEKVLNTIATGAWEAADGHKAVGYWWGINSGVTDVQLSPDLPEGIKCLAGCLRRDIMDHSIDPFRFTLRDQQGVVHSEGDRWLEPEEIMHMDWLLDCVDGKIPAFEELKPVAQNVVRVLGVYRDQIPPEKEGVLL